MLLSNFLLFLIVDHSLSLFEEVLPAIFIQMFPIVAFTADASGIGRFDPSMLSDHDRFELFLTFDNPDDIADELLGDPLDHCSWSGVGCEDGHIIKITWMNLFEEVRGEINMSMLPSHVEFLMLENEPIRGEADLTHLPDTMKTLSIVNCQVTGTLDFHALSPKIEEITFKKNRIEEILNFINLPETLVGIEIDEENAVLNGCEVESLPDFVTIKVKSDYLEEVDYSIDSSLSLFGDLE